MNAQAAMLAELNRLRHRLPDVTGTVLGDVDGMLVISDLPGTDAHHIAALAAAGAGIGGRFAQVAGHGPLRESVVRASGGTVVIYPAGYALLTVVAYPEVDLPRLHPQARAVAHRLAELWNPLRDTAVSGPAPSNADPHAPLAVRTPMATLPAELWTDSRHRPPAMGL